MYARLTCLVALVLCLAGCSGSQPADHEVIGNGSGPGKTPETLSIPACEDVPQFTDITVDPVVPGGMTPKEIQDKIADGWVDGTMMRSQEHCLVMFRNRISGQTEWRCGTIPEGTRILKSPAGDIALCTTCTNGVGIETIKDSWFPR